MDMETHVQQDSDRGNRAGQAVGDVYVQAAQSAADYLQAFIDVPTRSIDEWQEVQKTWIDLIGRTTELTVRAARDFAGCRDLQQFVEMQRHYMQEGRKHLLEASTQMLDISTRAAENTGARMDDALREGENRAATSTRRRRAS